MSEMRETYAEVLEVRNLVCGACGVELDLMDPWRRWGRTILHPGCFLLFVWFQGVLLNLWNLLECVRFWCARRKRRLKFRWKKLKEQREKEEKQRRIREAAILAFSPADHSSCIPYRELEEMERPRPWPPVRAGDRRKHEREENAAGRVADGSREA